VSKFNSVVKHYRHLIENFLSLSILNGLNFILPLITLPYLVRILGPDKYGAVSFATVIVQYIVLISNYGFQYSATSQISQKRTDLKKITEIFNAVIFIRISLALILTLLLFCFGIFVKKIFDERLMYFFSIGIIIGDIFIPTWLFQGFEKMKFITLANFTAKVIFTLLIFIFIKVKSDYPLVLLINSFGYLLSGILSMLLVFYIFKIKPGLAKLKDIKEQLVEGWHVFVSTLNINLYRNANTLIIGALTNNSIVGIYSSGEKIVKALQSVFSPFLDTIFPYLSNKFSFQTKTKSIENIFTISKYYSIILFLVFLLVFAFASVLVKLLLGPDFQDAHKVIRVLSPIIIIGGLNYLFGIVGMINLDGKKEFTKFVIISGLSNIVITFSLVPFLSYIGASIGVLFSEFSLFVLCLTWLHKKSKAQA